TDQTVQYESSDESVATVSPEGIVKGISVSEVPVVITCTYVPTGKVALCLVTVESRVKLTLSPTKKTIVKGRSFTIKKTITPSKFKNTPAQWKSSNTKIATVSQAGKVTTKKVGTCVITCELVNYKVKATCTVKVTKVKTTIKLNKSSIRINIGQTYKLKSTVTSNDTKTPSVRYTSKNKKVATVGKTNGKIKGKKVGSTIITAKTTDAAHATARCRVTVIRRATSLNLNKNYAICFIGGTIRLKATVKPKSASIKKLQWSTSDDTIASVDQNGKVSGLQEGDIYITVKTTDGSNLSDRCYVRVMEEIPASSVTVAQTKLTMKKGDTANLSFTLLPTNTTDTVSMASDNKRVATVTDAGKITAVGTGTATITIMTTSGVISTVEVHVVDLNKSSIRMRQYDTDTLVVTGTDDTITWYSANNRIATVANGTVTGRAIGTTYIYAYVDGCKLACRVQIVSVNNNQR
ncbi:MAG: Ig-like domain-containing protein, partial [Lachnospiraceae bacterium]|nr:Ig-like domain-containing protein [Lachnospiraceae bacterium]